jgi:hypothetical protein
MPVDKKRLADLMGEKQYMRARPLRVPIIRLCGKTGVFKRLDIGKDSYEKPTEIGKIVSGVVIGVRMQLTEYSKSVRRSSNEYDSPAERIIVWETVKDTREKIAEGSSEELREKYQKLRSLRWLYMIVNDEMVKFQVKGFGLSYLFEYFRNLNELGKHLFEVVTEIQPAMEEGELGTFWAPHFAVSKDLSEKELEKVAPQLEALQSNISELKEQYASAKPSDGVDIVSDDGEVIIDSEDTQ